MPTRMAPHNRPTPTRPGGPIQSLSMAYFTKNPIPKTRTAMPILLTRFSPMNFSRSGWRSKNPCAGVGVITGCDGEVTGSIGEVTASIEEVACRTGEGADCDEGATFG